jgi:hypothetical protein
VHGCRPGAGSDSGVDYLDISVVAQHPTKDGHWTGKRFKADQSCTRPAVARDECELALIRTYVQNSPNRRRKGEILMLCRSGDAVT